MKISVDIDCTPDEARRFLGLPDVADMQEKLVREMQEKMLENIRAMDPESMMKTWLPMGIQSVEQMQKNFWDQMASAMGGAAASKEDKKK